MQSQEIPSSWEMQGLEGGSLLCMRELPLSTTAKELRHGTEEGQHLLQLSPFKNPQISHKTLPF